MKLKKVASLCSKTKIFCLYDREESGGEVSQWLGDSSAIYPITGLPYMDEENIYSMFDISAKQQEKIIFRHQHAPEGINISDTDPTEHRIDEESLSLVYDGGVLKPLQTRNGISFIQNKYLSPLEDVIDMVQLYERETPQGMTYIVAKTGLFVAAVIMPYNVINEKFVYHLSALARQCSRAGGKEDRPTRDGSHRQNTVPNQRRRKHRGNHQFPRRNGGRTMKLAAFNATCPFEIGDKIKSRRRVKPGEAETFRLDPAAVVEEVHTITDIVCVHSVKNGTVTFLHELDNSGKLVHIAATPRPEQREAATQSGGVMLIAGDESGPLPPEFVDFIKRRFE